MLFVFVLVLWIQNSVSYQIKRCFWSIIMGEFQQLNKLGFILFALRWHDSDALWNDEGYLKEHPSCILFSRSLNPWALFCDYQVVLWGWIVVLLYCTILIWVGFGLRNVYHVYSSRISMLNTLRSVASNIKA